MYSMYLIAYLPKAIEIPVFVLHSSSMVLAQLTVVFKASSSP